MSRTLTGVEKAIAEYIKLRDEKAEIKKRHAAELENINTRMETLEAKFALALEKTKLTSFVTASGTAYPTVRYTATVKDRDAFLAYVRDENVWYLLPSQANDKAVRELNEEGITVPGVEVTGVRRINVKRK